MNDSSSTATPKGVWLAAIATICFLVLPLVAHGKSIDIENAVRETARDLIDRVPAKTLTSLDSGTISPLLSTQQREVLSDGLIQFRVEEPARISVLCERSDNDEPFWLPAKGFERTGLHIRVGDKTYSVWQKNVEPGPVNLGVGPMDRSTYPYFVAVASMDSTPVDILDLSGDDLERGILKTGSQPVVDRDLQVGPLPKDLVGHTLIRTSRKAQQRTALRSYFHPTKYPSSTTPDQVVLTWSEDPATTQTIQWRSSASVASSSVRYRPVSTRLLNQSFETIAATSELMINPDVVNDPTNLRHAVVLRNLRPGTMYEYSVGDQQTDTWTPLNTFRTAPSSSSSFSFIYTGDAQNGMKEWGDLIKKAFINNPDAAFYILAGDLVDRGSDRDDWDNFFANGTRVFSAIPLLPALGNHEYRGDLGGKLYRRMMRLPSNGPSQMEAGGAYAVPYANCLIVVLDSNDDESIQALWLESVLSRSEATWKVVVFHHPLYASHPDRDHSNLEKAWRLIFERHGVDLVLQGHDHAYMRTHPMYNGMPVPNGKGIYYVVSVAGTKFYEQAIRPYTAVGLTQTRTYQRIAIDQQSRILTYEAIDDDGIIVDRFSVSK